MIFDKETTMAFFELRHYRTQPGQHENWGKYMEEAITPFQISKGMAIVGSFVGEEEEVLYVWIGRFESEENGRNYIKHLKPAHNFSSVFLTNHVSCKATFITRENQPTPDMLVAITNDFTVILF